MRQKGILVIAAWTVLGCSNGLDTTTTTAAQPARPAEQVAYKVETFVSDLQVPWSIVWTAPNRMLLTERPGRVRQVLDGKLSQQPLLTLSDVFASSESGLMGLCLHPNYKDNKLIYISYAYREAGSEWVRIARYRDTGSQLVEPRTILERIPAAPNHAGCRIKFGPDGKLYVTTGDATDRRIAQQMDNLGGKTLRLNDDGSAPSDNPFVNQSGARPEIWTIGHRNAQGLDWQPGNGLMFQTEHGPSGFDGPGGGDEVNIVEKGKNYGWPLVHHEESRQGLVSPLLEYTPAVAPASGVFYNADVFPQFKGNYFFGCLRGQRVIRVVLDGRKVASQENLLREYGRIRDVAVGPDGYLYFSTSNRDGRGQPARNDDRIMRLVPQ